jgi:signal transduction histidine kinase
MVRKKVILVIEDNDELREEIAEYLRWDNFEVVEASNGVEGINLALTTLPDLIVSDIMMPYVDGFGVLDTLRGEKSTAQIPFIFLTAQGEAHRMARKLGAEDFLTKPFSLSELLSTIHARLERQEQLAEVYEEQLDVAKKSFTRMVAHELRTPLISIKMVQDILRRKANNLTSKDAQELLDMMDSGTRRLTHLVEQIVMLTQIESGALDTRFVLEEGSLLSVHQLLIVAVDKGRDFSLRGKNIPITPPVVEEDSRVRCEPAAIKHALAEIISNALNFSKADSEVRITVTLSPQVAQITIEDHGSGMTPNEIRQALTSFEQPNREKQEQQGIGIGLPLACRIIDIHGGSVHIESVLDQGTRVTVELPIV